MTTIASKKNKSSPTGNFLNTAFAKPANVVWHRYMIKHPIPSKSAIIKVNFPEIRDIIEDKDNTAGIPNNGIIFSNMPIFTLEIINDNITKLAIEMILHHKHKTFEYRSL